MIQDVEDFHFINAAALRWATGSLGFNGWEDESVEMTA